MIELNSADTVFVMSRGIGGWGCNVHRITVQLHSIPLEYDVINR
jgi:hypothetical protein